MKMPAPAGKALFTTKNGSSKGNVSKTGPSGRQGASAERQGDTQPGRKLTFLLRSLNGG